MLQSQSTGHCKRMHILTRTRHWVPINSFYFNLAVKAFIVAIRQERDRETFGIKVREKAYIEIK